VGDSSLRVLLTKLLCHVACLTHHHNTCTAACVIA
jgi:hypothetical protein